MSVLRRYVSYRFISYFALVLSALSALALTLDLMEEADKVLRSAPNGPAALLRYSALRLPDIAAQMLPMVSLLGMLFTLGQFMKHRELVALWSSGVSPTGLIFAMLPVAVMLAAADFAQRHRRPGDAGRASLIGPCGGTEEHILIGENRDGVAA